VGEQQKGRDRRRRGGNGGGDACGGRAWGSGDDEGHGLGKGGGGDDVMVAWWRLEATFPFYGHGAFMDIWDWKEMGRK
jgi:hypothetical protein